MAIVSSFTRKNFGRSFQAWFDVQRIASAQQGFGMILSCKMESTGISNEKIQKRCEQKALLWDVLYELQIATFIWVGMAFK